jgi:hypothetical protein
MTAPATHAILPTGRKATAGDGRARAWAGPHSMVPARYLATALLLVGVASAAPACAEPQICVGAMTDIDVMFRVKQDGYFKQRPAARILGLDYDGCGYRIRAGSGAPNSPDADLLLVDRNGRVTRIVHRN